jgi:hypothetical protein
MRNLQDEQGRRALYQITRKNATMVHKDVIRWLDHMLKQHPEGTCLGYYVTVINTKLVVVALPPPQRFTWQEEPFTHLLEPTSMTTYIPTITVDGSYFLLRPVLMNPSKDIALRLRKWSTVWKRYSTSWYQIPPMILPTCLMMKRRAHRRSKTSNGEQRRVFLHERNMKRYRLLQKPKLELDEVVYTATSSIRFVEAA